MIVGTIDEKISCVLALKNVMSNTILHCGIAQCVSIDFQYNTLLALLYF